MKLYGKSWSRRELEARVGKIEQIAGIKRFVTTEGNEAGVEQIQIRTGAGLSYYITPSKGLDISLAEFHGIPISWQSPNGDAHPAYYDAAGNGWLRTASGGLLMTCGLMQVGASGEDDGERLGLHGRIHHTPARQVTAVSNWFEDEMEMRISGEVEETSIFGGCLRLSRQIRSRLGENEIFIQDEVRNMGFQRCPHMILYHFNFGFPLLSEETAINFKDTSVQARESENSISGYQEWQAPDANYQERVYYHHIHGEPEVQIVNKHFPLHDGETEVQVTLQWSSDTLPKLVQWKMPGAGTHVLGIEPANCHVGGRHKEREQGTLVFLEPGETVKYNLRLILK
ncbi:aldose 1-epimerase family protein [Paenibacillus alginolyticus]|uniref:Aldose 1-epimerase family protein n=1 Tax=Paenibacillus alginolyticus TaxID=59839 RepID=A0ABT4GG07_9BACL|nr:aldose 1-epimerase family protein [Paenibacillus alginolyticus]MCY9695126.1 aldose 1-epimerase family protein [Paenibacillus alginolyticus]MEC0147941.1 aldose 1-epimerase family protein [Paenibacillus alginolyticus]